MLDQGRAFAQLMRVLSLEMDHVHIVQAEDSVVVHSQGRLRFQIQTRKIAGMLPHVAGNERITLRLIGQVTEVVTGDNYFPASNVCILRRISNHR